MSRYSCNWEESKGERICQLRDEHTDTEVGIAATFGMNVIRFTAQGQPVLLSPPSMPDLRKAPFRYGIPVLSPPGRTSEGRFRHRGRLYQFPLNVGRHNVHGEIGTLPWEFVRQQCGPEEGAMVEAQFAYKSAPELYAYFPHELTYTLTYRLREGKLSLEGTVSNKGEQFAPLVLGFHPYFEFRGDRGDVQLQLPDVSSEWPLDDEGRANGLPKPTERAAQLRQGMALKELGGNYGVFRMEPDARHETFLCRLYERSLDRHIELQVDALFTALVVFLPAWGNAVSLEPHTCVPDAFNLPLDGKIAGINELAPGETKTFGWSIQVKREGN